MRILRIQVENLNSLYGTHTLDLERDLGGAPIFLIRGPTGAGKSTLLDAVALALFGRTARLESQQVKGVDALDPDDPRAVLSTDAGAGYAEVDFSLLHEGARQTYRARWTVRRARSQPDGRFQAPSRSLIRLVDGEEQRPAIVESERKDAQSHFESILRGMSFDDFTRSVLLAQGAFEAFLKASEGERAGLLERLSDVRVFRRIGEASRARHEAARQAVAIAEAGIGDVRTLDDASVASLQADLTSAGARLSELTAARARARTEAEGRAELARAIRRQDAVRVELAHMAAQAPEIDALRQALELHATARNAVARGADAATRAAQVAIRGSRLDALTAEAVAASPRTHAAEAARDVATARVIEAEAERERMRPILEDIRERLGAHARQRRLLEVAEAGLAEGLRQRDEAVRRQAEATERLVNAEEATARGRVALAELCAGRDPADFRAEVARAVELFAVHEDAVSRLGEAQAAARRSAERTSEAEVALAGATKAALAAARHVEVTTQEAAAASGLLRAAAGTRAPEAALEVAEDDERAARARLDRLGRLTTERTRLAAREALGPDLETDCAGARERLAAALSRKASLEANLRALDAEETATREAELHLRGVVEVARRRGLLRGGEACPLCGSADHPYVDGGHAPPEEAGQLALAKQLAEQLRKDAARRETMQQDLQVLPLQACLATEAQADAALKAHVEALAGLRDACAAAATEAGLEAAASDADIRDARAATENAERSATTARRTLREALARSAEADRALREATHVHTVAEVRKSDALRALAVARQALAETAAVEGAARAAAQEAEAAVGEALTGLGVVAPDTTLGEAVAACSTRAAKVGPWQARLDARIADIARAQAEVERLHGEIAGRDATVVDQQDHLRALRLEAGRLEAAAAEASHAIGGQAPDAVDALLDATVKHATNQLATATQACADEVRRREVIEAQRVFEAAELDRERTALKAAHEALNAALGSGPGWGALADAQAALLAPDVTVAHETAIEAAEEQALALRGREAAARDELARASADGEAAGWRAAEATLPFADDADRATEDARGRLVALDADVDAATLAVHALRMRLAEDLELRTRLADRLAVIAGLRDEASRWEAIHKLVGAGPRPGDAFVRLAQAFQLEELVARANARLTTLSRRYRLAVRHADGLPTLSFDVRDLEQAARTRPTTTLSGGESFVLSLALALALGDLQGVEMPIETVLIDEGFGTLDAASLGAVLSALETLHASAGVQVGLISHVPLLAERIPARISVVPCGQGRSEVRVER